MKNPHVVTLLSATILAVSSLSGYCQGANGDRPALKETPARLLEVIDSTCRVNLAAACINVTRDAVEKRLRLYATSSRIKSGPRKIGGFTVDVIFNDKLLAENKKSAGAYHAAHNGQVFSFAIAQFAAGKKEFGLRLVRLIAEVDPEFWCFTPSRSPFPVEEIVTGLERGGDSVAELLKYESEQWENTVKTYGPESG